METKPNQKNNPTDTKSTKTKSKSKPFYQKSWFLILVTLGILALLFGLLMIIEEQEGSPNSRPHHYPYDPGPFVLEKPILYLYPEKTTEVEVKLARPNLITTNYPKYGNGWKVTAQPNGDLVTSDGKNFYALYWEESEPETPDFSEGFYVKAAQSAEFLEQKLTEIGLNDRERNEFIMHWLPKLEANQGNLIQFILTDELEQHNQLQISPTVDSLLRVHMHFKPASKEVKIKPQTFAGFERRGFVAVEWGGVEHDK